MDQGHLNIGEKARRLGADAARAITGADGERRRQRAELRDQGVGPGAGFGGPGAAEEGVQERSAPFRVSRRRWQCVPAASSSRIG